MSIDEWHERSFLIEQKPRTEYASLFIDCPPPNGPATSSLIGGDSATVTGADETVERSCAWAVFKSDDAGTATDDAGTATDDVRKSDSKATVVDAKPDKTLASGAVASTAAAVATARKSSNEHSGDRIQRSRSDARSPSIQNHQTINVHESSVELCVENGRTYVAFLGDVIFRPETINSLNWADKQNLLMCKVCINTNQSPLVPKTFCRLAHDILSNVLLDEYVETAGEGVAIECAACCSSLIDNSNSVLKLHSLPEDDWINTSPSLEYFCSDICGSHLSCSDHRARSDHHIRLTSYDAQQKWLPSEKRIFISDSLIFLSKKVILADAVKCDGTNRIVHCGKCSNELGTIARNHPDVLQLHHSVCNVSSNSLRQTYMQSRFQNLERFFAWMLMHKSESHTSLKLVFRSCDRKPHLLIWLLESYVILTFGDLVKSSNQQQPFHSLTAIKMLYKIFDTETARTDPRANGQDASVGLVDVPLECCVKLSKILLSSTLALPPAGRSVGQFYVGFLRLQ